MERSKREESSRTKEVGQLADEIFQPFTQPVTSKRNRARHEPLSRLRSLLATAKARPDKLSISAHMVLDPSLPLIRIRQLTSGSDSPSAISSSFTSSTTWAMASFVSPLVCSLFPFSSLICGSDIGAGEVGDVGMEDEAEVPATVEVRLGRSEGRGVVGEEAMGSDGL